MKEGYVPTPAELRQLLDYNPETGELFWKERTPDMFNGGTPEVSCRRWNARYAGKPAFSQIKDRGYRSGKLARKDQLAHRVAFAVHHGRWPDDEIDHINGDPSDNRIDNLREVTVVGNKRNLPTPKTNTSGVLGVRWNKKSSKWVSYIGAGKASAIFLGSFSTLEEATAARSGAERALGYHPNHGRAGR